jgi:RNA polymerase sigma-70 factor (ECF subfamily)
VAIRIEDIDLGRDRALVEAWQAGDASAFDDLYTRYFDRLRAFCQRRVGDRVEAEELAQEAFVKALQALPRFDGERRFYPWMTVIASRLCIDHHRRRGRVEPSDEIDLGTVDDGHEDRLRERVDLEHLHRALGRLGPRHVEVLDLRERKGLTYDEIAGELGVPHSTVEALLFRARRALRREFHLVSAERLAGVPVLGWLLERGARMRDRIALAGADLGAITAPFAAGAVTAVLVAIPGGSPAPVNVVMQQPTAATTIVSTTESPAPADLTEPVAPDGSKRTHELAAPSVQTTSGEDAANAAGGMPLHLDLDHTGIGLDPGPVVGQLSSPQEGNQE